LAARNGPHFGLSPIILVSRKGKGIKLMAETGKIFRKTKQKELMFNINRLYFIIVKHHGVITRFIIRWKFSQRLGLQGHEWLGKVKTTTVEIALQTN
jgi:hypothetical protein